MSDICESTVTSTLRNEQTSTPMTSWPWTIALNNIEKMFELSSCSLKSDIYIDRVPTKYFRKELDINLEN